MLKLQEDVSRSADTNALELTRSRASLHGLLPALSTASLRMPIADASPLKVKRTSSEPRQTAPSRRRRTASGQFPAGDGSSTLRMPPLKRSLSESEAGAAAGSTDLNTVGSSALGREGLRHRSQSAASRSSSGYSSACSSPMTPRSEGDQSAHGGRIFTGTPVVSLPPSLLGNIPEDGHHQDQQNLQEQLHQDLESGEADLLLGNIFGEIFGDKGSLGEETHGPLTFVALPPTGLMDDLIGAFLPNISGSTLDDEWE